MLIGPPALLMHPLSTRSRSGPRAELLHWPGWNAVFDAGGFVSLGQLQWESTQRVRPGRRPGWMPVLLVSCPVHVGHAASFPIPSHDATLPSVEPCLKQSCTRRPASPQTTRAKGSASLLAAPHAAHTPHAAVSEPARRASCAPCPSPVASRPRQRRQHHGGSRPRAATTVAAAGCDATSPSRHASNARPTGSSAWAMAPSFAGPTCRCRRRRRRLPRGDEQLLGNQPGVRTATFPNRQPANHRKRPSPALAVELPPPPPAPTRCWSCGGPRPLPMPSALPCSTLSSAG